MRQIGKSLLAILLVVLIAVLGMFIYANYTERIRNEKELQETESIPVISPVISSDNENEEPGNAADVSLLFCGDLVCHTGLNSEALKDDSSYDYANILGGAVDLIKEADYAACTLETTFPETAEYTGYPLFKSPPDLAESLKRSGFDLINTASNHLMDGEKAGIMRTLDILDDNGLEHVGTYRSREERDESNGIILKEINGISFAIMSYTYGTNGIPMNGFEYCANIMFTDYLTTLVNIDYDRLTADMEAAEALEADMTIVMLHWGNEYQLEPNYQQEELADFFFSNGADIIIGGHTHCPEPMELRKVKDEDGKERSCFIVYSLGNLISCQDDRYTNLTAALQIDIQKDLDTSETYLRQVSYTPLFMADLLDSGEMTDWRYKLLDLNGAISSYESGNNLGFINKELHKDMKDGLKDLHGVFGEEFSKINGGVDVSEWNILND